jgi:hypothetical protein
MQEYKDFQTIYNEMMDVLGNASDEEKTEAVTELLETGSVTIYNKPFIAHVFSISAFNHTIANDEPTEIDIDLDDLEIEVIEDAED